MAEKNDQWRQKYYDSLEELENRGKEWQLLEDLFKQAISRLTLAAEGNSKNLDKGLGELRQAIRKGKGNQMIHSILDNVSQEIIKLDKQAKTTVSGDAGFLLNLITQMKLSGKAEKKSRKLLKLLNSKKPPEQAELIQYFRELLSEVVKQAISEAEKNKGAQTGGFLKHLFSSDKNSSADDMPPTSDEALTKQSTSLDDEILPVESALSESNLNDNAVNESERDIELNQEQFSSVVATVQNVLESIIDGLDIQDDVKEELKNKVFKVKPTKEIHVLLDDLTDILQNTGILDGHNELLEGVTEHHELLIRLIEFLPLEDAVKDKAEKLKNEFSQGVTTAQLPEALKSIAELINKMRSNVQQEQKEFELFLQNLTGRLKEVHEHLKNSLQEQQSSYQSGIDLDNAVKEQVKGLGSSVSADTNFDDMEKTVQNHLDAIVKHIDLHRSKEDERVNRIEAQNKKLSEKLSELEVESSSLRKKVIASQNKALIDPLTQLPNRLAYEQRLQQEYARWRRYNSTLIIMVWDIDFFKKVNDNYGHQAGDKVLKVVANLLSNNLRETDFVGRFGGEEFVGLMPETTLGGGFKIAEKIRASIEKLEFHYQGSHVKVSISCGITLFMENDTAESAFERADKALYQAKDQGRNRCVIAKEQ